MLENTDLDEIPRLVKFNGMVVNNFGRRLGTSSKEFREIVHGDHTKGRESQLIGYPEPAVSLPRSDRELAISIPRHLFCHFLLRCLLAIHLSRT
jgi:hypothetical protein